MPMILGGAARRSGGSLPSGGTTGEVLTKLSNASGDAGWEPGGGSSPIESDEIVLTDAQIKSLKVPIVIEAPDDADHVPVLTDVVIVLDDSNGVYVDPNGGFNLKIGYGPDPTDPTTLIMDNLTIADAGMGAPGPGVWPFWAGLHGFTSFLAGWYWGSEIGAGFGAVPTPTTAIMIGKSGANNYTGGGAGNTLTIRYQYSSLRITP